MAASQVASTSAAAHLPDSLHISQLSVRLPIGLDNWERTSPQPVNIDIQVHTDVSKAGKSDHLPYSIHYGILVKAVEKHCADAGNRYRNLEALADGIAKVCLFECKAPRVSLKLQKPRCLLHAKYAGVEISRTASDYVHADGKTAMHGADIQDQSSLSLSPHSTAALEDKLVIHDLDISTILGVNPWERIDKQIVRVNLVIFSGLDKNTHGASSLDDITGPQDYRTIVRSITEHVEQTAYKTVESLALSIAQVAIVQNRVSRIKVRADKPSAIMFAKAAGCEVERDRASFASELLGEVSRPPVSNGRTVVGTAAPAAQSTPTTQAPSTSSNGTHSAETSNHTAAAPSHWHVAAIALGSNLGDRAVNIEKAVAALSSHPDCRLVDTSFLYETKPMYYAAQPSFLNGACRIATRLSPEDLLDVTQAIETTLGRDKTGVPEKGPRLVDLDILFYDRVEMTTERLTIPHPLLQEREFVLRPLVDILPAYAHPVLGRSVQQLLGVLINQPDYVPQDVCRVMPITAASPTHPLDGTPPPPTQYWTWGSRTFIMGIINATPDSFSDGGDHLTANAAVETAQRMVTQGVDVLDIGGMSTAPHAPEISSREEIDRVVPVIQAIRSAGVTVPISIDTFRSDVASAALDAGANMLNDVSGGERDARVLDVVAQRGVPYILMHTRGDSRTMGALNNYTDVGGVVAGVSLELEQRVERALKAGVRRWNIVLDPGIGFAKDLQGNLELLRELATLTGGGGNAGMVSTPSDGSLPPERFVTGTLKRHAQARPVGWNGGEHAHAHAPHPTLYAFPVLLGTSRKRFIGTVTGQQEPKDRVYGTAATCTAGISAGADILRVHDVAEMRDVARMADAVFRRREVKLAKE